MYVFYAAWIFILIQGVLAIPKHGVWVPFSVWGYGATQTFSFGLIHGFRNLLIPSPKHQYKPKDISLNIIGCLIFLFLSHWLIDIGRFNSLSILFLQLPFSGLAVAWDASKSYLKIGQMKCFQQTLIHLELEKTYVLRTRRPYGMV